MAVAIVVAWFLLFGFLGLYIAGEKNRSGAEGILLGALFGPLGVLIEALLPSQGQHATYRTRPAAGGLTASERLLGQEADLRRQVRDLLKRQNDLDDQLAAGRIGHAEHKTRRHRLEDEQLAIESEIADLRARIGRS